MKNILIIITIALSINACAQTRVGGGCEGCESIYESPIPFAKLSSTDTLPDFNEPGPKIMISGVIYERDGKTPAPGVVLYIYHTDQKGLYSKKGGEKNWALRHGYIRGWVKSNEKGEYRFYTLRPASYPNSNNPQHIHPTIKEPGKNEYWIDEYTFDDDPLLDAKARSQNQTRGGDGIIKLQKQGNLLVGKRDIVLGLNVPGY